MNIPKPPEPPPPRRIKEGARGFCKKCGSSFKTTFWGKIRGCIQPKCENYYKLEKKV